jgi:hypothetical protein
MYMTTDGLLRMIGASEAIDSRPPAATRLSTTKQAIALYVLGIFVETLGLGLIAAYGWYVAGSLIAVAGFALATIGNRRWPEPDQPVSLLTHMPGYHRGRGRTSQTQR